MRSRPSPRAESRAQSDASPVHAAALSAGRRRTSDRRMRSASCSSRPSVSGLSTSILSSPANSTMSCDSGASPRSSTHACRMSSRSFDSTSRSPALAAASSKGFPRRKWARRVSTMGRDSRTGAVLDGCVTIVRRSLPASSRRRMRPWTGLPSLQRRNCRTHWATAEARRECGRPDMLRRRFA